MTQEARHRLSGHSTSTVVDCRINEAVPTYAGVVKLADARDSKSRSLRGVWVRFPPPAPRIVTNLAGRLSRSGCSRARWRRIVIVACGGRQDSSQTRSSDPSLFRLYFETGRTRATKGLQSTTLGAIRKAPRTSCASVAVGRVKISVGRRPTFALLSLTNDGSMPQGQNQVFLNRRSAGDRVVLHHDLNRKITHLSCRSSGIWPMASSCRCRDILSSFSNRRLVKIFSRASSSRNALLNARRFSSSVPSTAAGSTIPQ